MNDGPPDKNHGADLASTRPLFGLVLAGGFSRRMGRDKGLLPIGPVPARDHFRQLLLACCDQVWVSLRPEQVMANPKDAVLASYALPDLFPGEGPLGALLSAFHFRGDADWMILPCDLPNMTPRVLHDMRSLWVGSQSTRRVHPPSALLLRHPERPFPEPLAGIWSCESGALIDESFHAGVRAVFSLLPKLSVQEMIPEDLHTLNNRNEF